MMRRNYRMVSPPYSAAISSVPRSRVHQRILSQVIKARPSIHVPTAAQAETSDGHCRCNMKRKIKRISSLSKVRSCLFRSPNANSSTKTLDFDDGSPLATTIPVARRRRIAEITDENTDADTFNLPFARASKRPEPLMNESPRLVKRSRRSNNFFEVVKDCSSGEATMFEMPKCRSLQKSFSTSGIETAAVIETISTKMEIEMKMETDT